MNAVRHYKILGMLWLMLGSIISVVFVVKLYRVLVIIGLGEILDSVLESILIALVVSFLTALSGWMLLKRHRWGRIATIIISLIYIAYGALYILFGAAEEEGAVTTIVVLLLLVLGSYSLFFLLVKKEGSE